VKYRTFLLSAAASIPAMAAQPVFADQAGSRDVSEIVVTASPLAQNVNETATPVIVLSGEELVRRRQATLGETLAGQPDVNFDNFGGGASRPLIRGQASEGGRDRRRPYHKTEARPLRAESMKVVTFAAFNAAFFWSMIR